jgi:hypothetical protein
MAHDGFIINYALNGPSRRVDAIVEFLSDLIFENVPTNAT